MRVCVLGCVKRVYVYTRVCVRGCGICMCCIVLCCVVLCCVVLCVRVERVCVVVVVVVVVVVHLSKALGGLATLITITSDTWFEIPWATDAMQSDTPSTGLVTTPATPRPGG